MITLNFNKIINSLFLLILCFCFSIVKANDSFYIFAVGQGNCQMCVYDIPTIGNVAILYDAGTSSAQTHCKFNYESKKFIEFLSKSTENITKSPLKTILGTASSSKVSPGQTLPKQTSRRKKVTDSKKPIESSVTYKDIYQETIQDTIKSYDLKQLFVFASHPDKDHINYLKDILPEEVPLIAFLGGDWIGKSIKIEEGKDINEALDFFSKRKQTIFELPYYWNCSNYEDIKQGRNALQDDFIPGSRFCGTLHDLLEIVSEKNKDSQEYSDIFAQLKISGEWKNEFKIKFLNKVFLWSFNNIDDDINNQSIVLSCTNESLNMSLVMTGDAGNSVFQEIARQAFEENNIKEDILRETIKMDKHNIILMLPHHGSKHNISPIMIPLFKANAFGISAGNGAQHAHPSLEVIRYVADKTSPESSKSFYDLYKLDKEIFAFFAFTAGGPKTVHSFNLGRPIFFCTNIHGSVKITDNLIYQQYIPEFTYDETKYLVAINLHIASIDLSIEKIFLLNPEKIVWNLEYQQLMEENLTYQNIYSSAFPKMIKSEVEGKHFFISKEDGIAFYLVEVQNEDRETITYLYIAKSFKDALKIRPGDALTE